MAEERLQKVLARGGIASRRAAEALISAGRVRINGRIVKELGSKADPFKDRIEVDGRRVIAEQPVYVALHKPRGVVSTMSDPEGRPTVAELLAPLGARVYPVGRLDFATSGILLATNDGDFANGMLHPKKNVPKTYVLKVAGEMKDVDLDHWRNGVALEDGKTLPAQVKKLRIEAGKTWIEVTIHEGRNQQIRRMGEATSFPVMRLARTSFAGISSEGLAPGRMRALSREELVQLKKDFGVPKRIVAPADIAPTRNARVARTVVSSDRRGPPREERGGAPREERGRPPREERGRPAREERGAAPSARRGPPARDDRRGPPQRDDRRGPPQRDDRRGPPARDDRRGPPQRDDRKGAPPREGRRGPPARDDRSGAPAGARRGPPPRDDRRGPPARDDRRGPPQRDDRRGPPPREDRKGGPARDDRRGPPPRGDRKGAPSGDRRGPPAGRPPPRGEGGEKPSKSPARGGGDQERFGGGAPGRRPYDREQWGSGSGRGNSGPREQGQSEAPPGRGGRSRTTGTGGGVGAGEGDFRMDRGRSRRR